jgi:transcriptional regulator with XRE-family HTH domain
MKNYAQILSERILTLRREKNLTQEALAEQLGLSFQAISKWENSQSCPDIALLPQLADIFGVTIDALFGRETDAASEVAPVFSHCDALPWPDDHTLRGVVTWGHKILWHEKTKRQFSFNAADAKYSWLLRYSPLNVECRCDLHVEGDIQGNASAGTQIKCQNIIHGNASAGVAIGCMNIGGDASAGVSVGCMKAGSKTKKK